MAKIYSESIIGMESLFPDQIKVYELSTIEKSINENSPSLLDKHFYEPPCNELLKSLIWEIVHFLKDQDQFAVYSFFYRSNKDASLEAEWFLSSSRLNKCDEGFPKELVIFTYCLQSFGDIKKRLYQVLENNEFFKENFNKVANLTKREKEIIGLLAKGMSTAKIANMLFISVHTVNTHRKNINQKLVIKNIAGLLKFTDVFDLTLNENTL
ncbi:MAG TPA: helix-turn-helix transcriptional regulator [Panacibacter sp.]|nr:helix-turn-helix transcriptional regulator [Panacibacter sp.]